MSPQKKHGSLYQVLRSLKNIASELHRKAPALFYLLVFVIFLGIYGISNSPSLVLALMSTLVGILSLSVYFKNKSISESLLAFFLGLLTVFSITWTKSNTIIFTATFLLFFSLYFIIASIKIYADMESILTQAAGFLPSLGNDRESRFQQLKAVTDINTTNQQLGVIDRAKTVRFLAFLKFPINEMSSAVNSIEMIKTVYNISLEDTHKFYRDIYLISKRVEGRNTNYFDINNIFLSIIELPLTHEDFFSIFNTTRKTIIRKSLSLTLYMAMISNLIEEGYDNENIIDDINASA